MKIIFAITVLMLIASVIVGAIALISQEWVIVIASTLNAISMLANSILFYRRIEND